MDRDYIKEQMQGRWSEYFSERLGFDAESSVRVPCFICEAKHGSGGNDRFNWTDLNGNGGYYCRGAGDQHHSDGLGLTQALWKYTQGYDLTFPDVLAEIGNWLEGQPVRTEGYAKATSVSPEAQDKTHVALKSQNVSNLKVAMHPYVGDKCLQEGVLYRSHDTGVSVRGTEEVINVPYSAYDDPFGPRIGVEQIYPDGRKLTLAGTHKGVNVLGFNAKAKDPKWLVVEGWATGLALCSVLKAHGLGHRVAVSGGKGKLARTCAALPNARPIYEDDGDGTPDNHLHFIRTTNGNDIADHLKAGDRVAINHFIKQLEDANHG